MHLWGSPQKVVMEIDENRECIKKGWKRKKQVVPVVQVLH